MKFLKKSDHRIVTFQLGCLWAYIKRLDKIQHFDEATSFLTSIAAILGCNWDDVQISCNNWEKHHERFGLKLDVEVKPVDNDRLMELYHADREGRVIILPAMMVYEVMNVPGPACDGICPVEIDGKPCCNFCEHGIEIAPEVRCRQDHIERIGKDVFLTYEEASVYIADGKQEV